VAFEKKKHVIPRWRGIQSQSTDLDSDSSTRLGGHSQLDITTAIGGEFLLRTKTLIDLYPRTFLYFFSACSSDVAAHG